MLSLRLKHVIETAQGYYRIIIEDAKNGDFRYIYVIKYASLLRHYIETYNIRDPGQPLFPSPQRLGQPLHPRNIEKYLMRRGRKYGVRIHPHLLRHLRGTMWIKEKIPERVVMKLLGHRSEKMMRIYINLAHQDVEEAILQHYGIKTEAPAPTRIRKCLKCGAENREDANYCWRCGYPLNQQAAQKLETREKELEEKLLKLIKILKDHPEILEKL